MHGRVGGNPEKGLGVPMVWAGVYSGRAKGPGRQDEHLGHSSEKASDAKGRE